MRAPPRVLLNLFQTVWEGHEESPGNTLHAGVAGAGLLSCVVPTSLPKPKMAESLPETVASASTALSQVKRGAHVDDGTAVAVVLSANTAKRAAMAADRRVVAAMIDTLQVKYLSRVTNNLRKELEKETPARTREELGIYLCLDRPPTTSQRAW